MSGILYIVATPIGNLEDITFRAVRVLKEVDIIACEDTRMTKRLLDHYNIAIPMISYHQHSKLTKIDHIISELKAGKNIAVVTDAGTPGISDPGNILVAKTIENEIMTVPIPGATALTALASVSGIDMTRFQFLGFPPHKKGRETFFRNVASIEMPVAYYDSVHRVLKNLDLLKKMAPEKSVIVGRELTKMFEQIIRGDVEHVMNYFNDNPDKVKGEFVVIAY